MNSYQIALDFLAEECRTLKKGEAKEYINTLQELVEKATPKEVVLHQGLEVISWDGDCCSRGYTVDFWGCPTCYSYLCKYGDEDSQGSYCPKCGQALDWGEEDE